MMTLTLGSSIGALALAFGAVAAPADQVLFDFGDGFDVATVEARSVTVTKADGALRLDSRHDQDWPGITLKAPDGKWDLSAYARVEMDVRNVGANAAHPSLRVDNPGADGWNHCVQVGIELGPGESGTIVANLPSGPADPATGERLKFPGMRGWPGNIATSDFRADNVVQLIVFVPKPTEDHLLEISNIRAAGEADRDWPEPFLPFIDEFGQYSHRDWPGKVHSVEELRQRRDGEGAELAARPGPGGWDEYGGWASGPTLEATGFFRVEKVNGKWWLVDPNGKLFWSHGVDCVGATASTPIETRESWFADVPPREGEFASCWGTEGSRIGELAGREYACLNFSAANAMRKYGDEWLGPFADAAHRRLRSWGMNTIANWSDVRISSMRRTPYTATVHFGGRYLAASQGYWGPFRDVFDPSFGAEVKRAMAATVGRSAGDPWCIGFFVDNEIAWGDELSLAASTMASPADQPAKRVMVEDLRAKHGTIDALNAKWGTDYASWDALLGHEGYPDKNKAADDLRAFTTRTAEAYFKTIRDALKEVAPNQLYLGCRFAWVNPLAVAQATKYCDVVSYNLYQRSVADFKLPVDADVPLIIGEFHFGALDRGLFHTGLVPVASQEERAAAYRDYVRGALRHPQLVGTHWFQFMDEATTGRTLDGENYQIGLVDVADTPYPETIAAVREVGYGMYAYRYGEGR